MEKLKKFFDKTFLKFVLVGVVNTLFGTAIMFVFYNVFHLSYWLSSASNYVFGSILSYFLNKYFTFQSKGSNGKTIGRFVFNITICYLCAYGLAKPPSNAAQKAAQRCGARSQPHKTRPACSKRNFGCPLAALCFCSMLISLHRPPTF